MFLPTFSPNRLQHLPQDCAVADALIFESLKALGKETLASIKTPMLALNSTQNSAASPARTASREAALTSLRSPATLRRQLPQIPSSMTVVASQALS